VEKIVSFFYESRYDFEIMTQEKISGMVLKKWKIFFLKTGYRSDFFSKR
jgi:hypothetical protein